jgi:hypothetical protein
MNIQQFVTLLINSRLSNKQEVEEIAVGTAVTGGPPHRSVREVFPHTAPALSRARCRMFGRG